MESYQVAHDDLRFSTSCGWTAWKCGLCRCRLSTSGVLLDASYRSGCDCFRSIPCATTSASTTSCSLATGAKDLIEALV